MPEGECQELPRTLRYGCNGYIHHPHLPYYMLSWAENFPIFSEGNDRCAASYLAHGKEDKYNIYINRPSSYQCIILYADLKPRSKRESCADVHLYLPLPLALIIDMSVRRLFPNCILGGLVICVRILKDISMHSHCPENV